MQISFDDQDFQYIQHGIDKIIKYYEQADNFVRGSGGKTLEYRTAQKYDKSGALGAAGGLIDAQITRLSEFRRQLQSIRTQREQNLSANNTDMYDVSVTYTPFSETVDFDPSIDYGNSIAAAFVTSGFSFADYNDITNYQDQDYYKKASISWAVSEWGSWSTHAVNIFADNKNAYADELFESALEDILSELPDVDTKEWSGLYNVIPTGNIPAKDINGTIQKIKKFAADIIRDRSEIEDDEEYRKEYYKALEDLSNQIGGSEGGDIFIALKKYIGPDAIKKFDNVSDFMQYIDYAVTAFSKFFADYSVQLSYLDTMQNALLAQGYNAGTVYSKMNEIKRKYSSHVFNVFDYAADELMKSITKDGTSYVMKAAPPLKYANAFIGIVSGGTKIFAGDTIKAAKKLSGLQMYDQALTQTFDNYARKIAKGWATEQEIAEADKLFLILKGTKLKEYKHLMTLSENSDPALYALYKQKYDTISGWTSKEAILNGTA